MEFSKHKNHRNTGYLIWLRKQNCIISGDKAQCAHHIRLGTNGGSALKPSDYFCVPLLNSFHTTGSEAIHIIGEATFFDFFDIEITQLFQNQLANYLDETYGKRHKLDHLDVFDAIAHLIDEIEELRPVRTSKVSKKKPSKTKAKLKVKQNISKVAQVKMSDTDYYKQAQIFRKEKEKEMRDQMKEKQSAYRKEQYQLAKKRQAEYKLQLQNQK